MRTNIMQDDERTGVNAYTPNRAQRRLLARHGVDLSKLGRISNRLPGRAAAPLVPDEGPAEGTFEGRALPQDVAQWENYLQGIDSAEEFTKRFQSGEFKAALNSYANARSKERTELLDQLRTQTEAQMTEWLKENQNSFGNVIKVPDLDESKRSAGARPSPIYNNARAKGAPLNGVWPDYYTYLQDIWFSKGNGSMSAEARKRMDVYNTYSEKVPSEGGFLVPEEFRSQIMQLSLDSAVVRPRATIIPMSSPRIHIPSIDETSRVSSIYGGVVVYRTEEGAELTESSATFASIKLDVTKQTALSHVPNELIRDWGAFGAFMDATLPAAMGAYEDWDYISGSGVGAPLGGLSAANTALIAVAARSGQSAALGNQIVWENVIDMYARMLPTSLGSAVWVASPDTFAQLATMALSVGTGGSAVWLTDGRGAPVLTLLGRPVIMTGSAPAALGSQGDLSFVDWGMYLIGDYQNMTVDSSPHVKFTSDKTTFRAIARNDGRPWLQSPLTPHNNSATLSPFIGLAARP
jgi:HK97 family phage major capsid protein